MKLTIPAPFTRPPPKHTRHTTRHATRHATPVTDVPTGHVLATLPRGAVLSAASCGLRDVLRAERLGGGLALVAAVMYEAARGPASKW